MPTLEAIATEAPVRIVEQTRLIRASRARLYEAWTNPEILKLWFGPADRICSTAEIDARVGGAFRIGVTLKDRSDAQEATAAGHYTMLVPNKLVQFTWQPSWNPGEESLVTVSLEHVPGGTEVSIRHERVPCERFDGYSQGWEGSLTKLARSVERS
jgi:uncharacterized protein YndB with AHSA1/START domain